MNNLSFPEKKKNKENKTVKGNKLDIGNINQQSNLATPVEIAKKCDDLIQMINLLQQENPNKNISDALVCLEQAKESIELI